MSARPCTVRLATESDQAAWDQYVMGHADASPYHLFAWKSAVEQAYHHQGYYFLAESAGKMVGVLPTVQIRLPMLVNELVALPFCDVGNLLADNREIGEKLLGAALQCAKSTGARVSLRGRVDIPAAYVDRLFLVQSDKVRMSLPLPGSAEKLRQGFKSKLRSQIAKAEKNGLTFSWGGEGDLAQFYAVFAENMRDLGSPTHSRHWFAAVLNNYQDNARLGMVRYGEEAVGACLILTVAGKVSIPWASTLRAYNKLAPNMLLYWHVLQYAADSGCTSFDFGRSSVEEGTYRFKKQWGAQPEPLHWYTTERPKTGEPVPSQAAGRGKREVAARIWQKFPLPLANLLGPVLRKYISL